MDRAGATIRLLCIEHLHPFEAAVAAVDFECPECGCKYGRLDPYGEDTKAIVTVDVKDPWAVPVGPTWVSALPEKVEAVTEGN